MPQRLNEWLSPGQPWNQGRWCVWSDVHWDDITDDSGFHGVRAWGPVSPHQPCELCMVSLLVHLGKPRLTGLMALFLVMSFRVAELGLAHSCARGSSPWACGRVGVCAQTQVPCGREERAGSASPSWAVVLELRPHRPGCSGRSSVEAPAGREWVVLSVAALSGEWSVLYSVPSGSPVTLRWPQSWPGPTCLTASASDYPEPSVLL